MGKEDSSIGTKEASIILGVTARHVQNLIKRGTLTASRDEGGNYIIDKSEFYRVFPKTHTTGTNEKEAPTDSRILELEVKHLKEMLNEKTRQNEFLHQQLEGSNNEKSILMETLKSNQKMLEYTGTKKRSKFLGIF